MQAAQSLASFAHCIQLLLKGSIHSDGARMGWPALKGYSILARVCKLPRQTKKHHRANKEACGTKQRRALLLGMILASAT